MLGDDVPLWAARPIPSLGSGLLHSSGDNSGRVVTQDQVVEYLNRSSWAATEAWWAQVSPFYRARARAYARQFDYDVLVDRLAEGHYPDVSETCQECREDGTIELPMELERRAHERTDEATY